ncbi:MAG: phosphodiester glycosidase family protein [Verrucomicrobiales bacterium]
MERPDRPPLPDLRKSHRLPRETRSPVHHERRHLRARRHPHRPPYRRRQNPPPPQPPERARQLLPQTQRRLLDRHHRNGIGVDTEGNVIFAITGRGQVTNLWDFAGLFLKLDCRDALFLDGDISQAVTNPDKDIRSNRFAAIFVITE